MGYLTSFDLKTEQYIDREALSKTVTSVSGFTMQDNLILHDVTWYGWENDMRFVSKEYPGTLFILSGKGETDDDLWKAYFRDGKMQLTEAIITYEPFDESKLE